MNTLGFNRYRNLLDSNIVDGDPIVEKTSEVKSPEEVIIDQIFSCDENGWPRSSWEVFLSKKTSDDIRKYIQDNLMTLQSGQHAISDEKVVAAYRDLDSEFLAELSRNRYESVDQYEQRISEKIQQLRLSEETKKNFEAFKKKYATSD